MGPWEHGNTPSVLLKRGKIFEWLRNYQLLKKMDCVPLNYFGCSGTRKAKPNQSELKTCFVIYSDNNYISIM